MEYLKDVQGMIAEQGWTVPGIICACVILAGVIVGFVRGFVKELVSLTIVALTILAVWFAQPYVKQFLSEHTPLERTVRERCEELVAANTGGGTALKAEQQVDLIEDLGLPDLLTNALLDHNNAEGYKALRVSAFSDYVSEYLTDIIVNGISFLVTYAVIRILFAVIVYALDLFTRLPVIHGLNKLGGAVLGGTKYVVFLWLAMLVLTVLCNTSFGKAGLAMIHNDRILESLYSWNIFLRFFTKVF